MANKDRNKRAARKARQEERARIEAAQASSAPAGKDSSGKDASKDLAKKDAKKPAKKADPNKKPGPLKRLKNYLGDVRSEMKRVVWPTKDELRSYSIAIIIMLIVFGLVIWLVDSGIVGILVAYTGLRG